jgi:hypothetical protein
MTIKYSESLDPTGPVVIICKNWRNPILPEVITGFSVLTLGILRNAIDFTPNLSQIDATNFSPMAISDDSFEYHLSHYHANELSDYTISFNAGLPISAQDGCYVKFTFPPELGTSEINL